MATIEDKYVFHVEWFDPQGDVRRRYLLTYYAQDNSIDMYDTFNQRPFLKRSQYAEILLPHLYLGAVVTIMARQLTVVEYANAYTEKKLQKVRSQTLALIKPDACHAVGHVLTRAKRAGLVISRLVMVKMSADQAMDYHRLAGIDGQQVHVAHLQSGPCVAIEFVGPSAATVWADLMGPSSPSQAKKEAPASLRSELGRDDVRNAVHGSFDDAGAASEVEFFFGRNRAWRPTAALNCCTLAYIKPHAIPLAGEILTDIAAAGFEVSAMRFWYMDKAAAEDFLSVYKGVLPEYHDMVNQLCTGASLVMELRGDDVVLRFREFCGPHDPEVARHLRPQTLRAKYGLDRVRNAVHCTDLAEDGVLEVDNFFGPTRQL